MAFKGIDIKVIHQTSQWGVPIEAITISNGDAFLITVTDDHVKTYSLASSDAEISSLTLTDRVSRDI